MVDPATPDDTTMKDKPKAADDMKAGEEPEPVKESATPEPVTEPAAPEVEEVQPSPMGIKVDRSNSELINTILALVFLFMFGFSLFVVCIDFEVRWSLLSFVLLLMLVMGVLVADRMEIIELPSALSVLSQFTLFATPLFYYSVFLIWLLLMLVSAVIARLHYVKIEHNEVVEFGGVMEKQKRMSTFRMHWTKEIKDVFEYWLPFVRSGTLIFNFPNEEKPLILNNVMHINRVLKQLDEKSNTFQVKGME